MAEQQLVDYIKKAKETGQADEQTKLLLYKNGWTEAEVSDAFAVLVQPQAQPQPAMQPQVQQPQMRPAAQPQPQAQMQPQSMAAQPKMQPQMQPQVQPAQQSQPQSQTQYQPSMQSELQKSKNVSKTNMPAGMKRSGWILKLIICLIVLIVICVGGYFASQYFNLFGPTPETVILKAWQNLHTIKSENFNSEISLAGKNIKTNGTGGDFNIDVKFNGGADTVNQLADINGSLTASATDPTSNQYTISLAGEGKLIKNALYLQFSKIDLGTLSMLVEMFGGPDPSTITGQWFKFDLNNAAQQVKTASGQNIATSPQAETAMGKVVKILIDGKVFDIKQLADVNGSEGKEYHYNISINQKNLMAVSPQLFSAVEDYLNASGTSYDKTYSLADFQANLTDTFNKVGAVGIDLFIGKSDSFLRKIQITKDIDVSKFSNSASGIVTVNFEIDQTGINKPLQVSAPATFTDFNTFFSSYAIKSDMSQIVSMGQQICTANKFCNPLCKNGSVNGAEKLYGSQLTAEASDLVSKGAKNPVCFAGVTGFCVSAQLADGTWLCTDMTGNTGTTQCTSYNTVCK